MTFKVLPKMAWSTVLAFRRGKPCSIYNSCSLCGSDHTGTFGLTRLSPFSTTANRLIRGRNSRHRDKSDIVLLDKFIKQTNVDGTLVAKAPFSLSCSASYFDKENNINTARNKEVEASRDQFFREENARRRKERTGFIENQISTRDQIIEDSVDSTVATVDKGAEIYLEVEDLPPDISKSDVRDVERRILEQLSGQESIINSINKARSPLHVKLLGKSNLRVDSYSIVRNQRAHSSHLYISDVPSSMEAVTLMAEAGDNTQGKFSPSGSVSIWRRKQVSNVQISDHSGPWEDEEEEVVSALKIYAPDYITEDPDCGLKAVFQCPTLMNKIYLEGEKHAALDLSCKLMDQLVSVGLCTEYGPIRIRDVWSHDISLASRYGDIQCEGTLEGDIKAEITGDGDFSSKCIVGSKLKVTTDSGDISLWGDTFTETAELFTNTGNIHVRYLYGAGKILVKSEGSVSLNLVEGSLAVVVKSGPLFLNIDRLTEDSFLEVETGDITVTVPANPRFRMVVTGSSTNMAPAILNAGEVYIGADGVESFVSGVETGSEYLPTLTIKTRHGNISVQTQKDRSTRKRRSGISTESVLTSDL